MPGTNPSGANIFTCSSSHGRISCTALRPLLRNPVHARVLLDAHHGFNGRVAVNSIVPELLGLIPGTVILDHRARIPGHMCSAISGIPGELSRARREMLVAMEEVSADTLVTLFHSCHREAVSLERGRSIRVVNWVHLLAESKDLLPYIDEYKLWRNAADPHASIGEDRVAAMDGVVFDQLVQLELARPEP